MTLLYHPSWVTEKDIGYIDIPMYISFKILNEATKHCVFAMMIFSD